MLGSWILLSVGLAALAGVRPAEALYGGFVKTSGIDFVLDGCKRFFSATNMYYLTPAVGGNNRAMFDNGINVASAHGLEVIRILGYCESCSSPFVTFSNGAMTVQTTNMESLDYVLAGASQRNIRVVVMLTNNWADYGGMDEYTKALGGTYHDDFYTNTKIKAAFKQYIYAIVNRINHETGIAYKDDPTIFSWELANEPRCQGTGNLPRSSSCGPEVITAWADEMSTYIKSLDSNHMVAVGDEGFGLPASGGTPGNDYVYRLTEGTNFTQLVSLKNIDYGTFHMYPLSWGLTSIPTEGNQWITAHANVAKALNKPVVLEEFGLEDRSLQKTNYDAWYQQSITDHVSMAMFWMAAGSLYPNISNYHLYDADITRLIDPWTTKINAQNQCCYTSTLKSVNLTVTDTTLFDISGCLAACSECSTGCCNHGYSCVTVNSAGYKQCQPNLPTYRNATTGIPVVVTPDPCKGGTITTTTTTATKTTSTSVVTTTTTSRTIATTTASSSRTTTTTTTTAPSPSPTSTTACSVKWAQCGGLTWTGPKCCVSGTTCTYSNDWYSQCL